MRNILATKKQRKHEKIIKKPQTDKFLILYYTVIKFFISLERQERLQKTAQLRLEKKI